MLGQFFEWMELMSDAHGAYLVCHNDKYLASSMRAVWVKVTVKVPSGACADRSVDENVFEAQCSFAYYTIKDSIAVVPVHSSVVRRSRNYGIMKYNRWRLIEFGTICMTFRKRQHVCTKHPY